jgi:pSer/pThr/pTyr-binding forkhead associated (FHA) protein
MKISLMVLSAGSAAGKALPVTTAQFLIGRDPQCNLRPASAMISKRHCAVLVKGEQVFVRDFDSTNGTFLNEEQVKGELLLKDGDILKVGPLSFKVSIEGKPSVAKPTPPPQSKQTEVSDEDAAAAMLSIDDANGEVNLASRDTGGEVPGGSTIMDIPSYGQPGDGTVKEGDKKGDDKKTAGKKNVQGAAQDAAKAILEKLKQGRRK